MIGRSLGVALILTTAWLTYNRPFASFYVGAVLALCAAAQLRWTDAWLILLPALLPVIDLTLWSGRLFINEFDMLVLAISGIHLLQAPAGLEFPRFKGTGGLLLTLLIIAFAISMLIGAMPLPSPDANQLGSYLTNYNAFRVVKSLVWGLLLLAPLQRQIVRDPERAASRFIIGTAIGLALVGLVVLWERGVLLALAQSWGHLYAGRYAILGAVLDFTSEYRATALFSELHTGGEAIDTYLALAPPIVAAGILALRPATARLFCLVALLLGTYAVVATFSRGLYLGFGVGTLCVCLLAVFFKRHRQDRQYATIRITVGSFLAVTSLAFSYSHGGFDALCFGMALLVLGFVAAHLLGEQSLWLTVALLGAMLAAGVAALSYAFLASQYNSIDPTSAWQLAAILSVLLSAAAALAGMRTVTKEDRTSGAMMLLLFMTVMAIAIPATGGTRMLERFSEASTDARTRWKHWAEVYRLMGPDWQDYVFGMGLGRFPQLYFRRGLESEGSATYRFGADGARTWLELGIADFNMTQKIPLKPETKYRLSLMTRAVSADARLDIKLCPKLILFSDRYTPDCQEFVIPSTPKGEWVKHDIDFDSASLGKDLPLSWPITLMLGNASQSSLVDITDVVLTDGQTNIVSNGDFANGDHWIMISDFEHLPWHIKNLYLEVFFETGAIGLCVFAAALVTALVNAMRAVRRQDPIGLGISGSLVAFTLVGLTGSLLDNPRPATLFFILLLWALQPRLRASLGRQRAPSRHLSRTLPPVS
jgi:hypothetical protein